MAEKVLLINKVSPVCGDLLKEQGFEVEIGGNPNEQELDKARADGLLHSASAARPI